MFGHHHASPRSPIIGPTVVGPTGWALHEGQSLRWFFQLAFVAIPPALAILLSTCNLATKHAAIAPPQAISLSLSLTAHALPVSTDLPGRVGHTSEDSLTQPATLPPHQL